MRVGDRFGRLVALSYDHGSGKGLVYLCQCDCGNKKEVRGADLRSGNTKSCGCLAAEHSRKLVMDRKISEDELARRSTEPRECRGCGKMKNPEDFHRLTSHRCRQCAAEKIIHKKYGITSEDRNAMLAEQCGKCGICGKAAAPNTVQEDGLHVDHVHGSDFVRGLLCSNCNRMLGMAKDDVFILHSAIRYLQRAAINRREKKSD